jgi:hypothetical protein
MMFRERSQDQVRVEAFALSTRSLETVGCKQRLPLRPHLELGE